MSAATSRWPTPSAARSSRPASQHTEFIERATSDFEAYRAGVEPYTLEYAQRETGVPAEAIRELAHAFAKADRAMICWTLGITEHHNAVDNVLALINLALLTGHVGQYGSGLNPLRGQNNVQGGGDMGAIPDRLPGFQHVENDRLRAKFEQAWGVTIPDKRGRHLTAMCDAMACGDQRLLYVIGENPAQSEADQGRMRGMLEGLEFLVVQDLFLTKTAELADVVLPAAASWAESPRGRSRTRNGASSACARRRSRPATRATTCGSSPSSPAGWAATGAGPAPRMPGTSCGPCRRCTPE